MGKQNRWLRADGTYPAIGGGSDEAPVSLEEYEARQTEIRARIAELNTEYQGRAFDDDATTEWNSLNAELDSNATVIVELRARRDRVEELAGSSNATEGGSATFNTRRSGVARGEDIYDLSTVRSSVSNPAQARDEMRERALRAIDTARYPHERADQDTTKAHVERLLETHGERDGGELALRILATGSTTYKRAFSKYINGLPLNNAEAAAVAQARALSTADSGGGYAVPFVIDPTIMLTNDGAVNPLRQISRVETISGADTWKGITSAGITASRNSEVTEVGDDAPTLAQPEATVTKVDAFVPYSIEIGSDWSSLQSEMAKALQDAKDREEATSFVTGSGSGVNPEGILTGVTGTVAAGSASFAVAHLYAVTDALPDRFEPNARFLAHRAQYSRVRQFDTQGGSDLWVQLGQGQPGELLGYPAHRSSAMSSALTNGTPIMVFGDFSHFLIVDRIGMTIENIPHLFGASGRPVGQRGIYAYWRNTSKVLVPGAFRKLVPSAS